VGYSKNFRVILGVGLVVLVVSASYWLLFLKPVSREPLEIGAILSLTGPGEYYGREVRDGMMLAVDEVNSRGGVNGRMIELIIEDSETDTEKGVAAFNRIEEEHNPALYVSMLSLNCMELSPVVEESEVVLIGCVASAPELTEQREWVFRFYQTAEDDVTPIILILEELGVESLGIMYSDEDYGRSVAELLTEDFEEMGGNVKSEAIGMDEADFSEQIEEIRDMQAIYIVGYQNHYKEGFKELRETEYKGYILGATGTLSPSIMSMPESDGVYVASSIIYDPDYILARDVKERYESRYDKPFTFHSANGYDCIKLIAGLLEDEEISRRNVRNLLEGGFVHPGVFGEFHVKPGEHDIEIPLYPAQIVEGGIEYLW